ncbi:hypothetical protein ABT112_26750, partial [Streptomyces sp. NPDC002055]
TGGWSSCSVRSRPRCSSRAARAVRTIGPGHPRTRLLLTTAALAAAAAWDAGHRVTDLHQRRHQRRRSPIT